MKYCRVGGSAVAWQGRRIAGTEAEYRPRPNGLVEGRERASDYRSRDEDGDSASSVIKEICLLL